MTKLESADVLIEQEGCCAGIPCEECCCCVEDNDGRINCKCIDNLDYLAFAKQYKKEYGMKIKKGDSVKLKETAKTQSWYFDDTVMVVSIEENNDFVLSNGELINIHWLEKVEEKPVAPFVPFPHNLQKGDKVLCSDGCNRIFIAYRPELLEPFELVHNGYSKCYEEGEKYMTVHYEERAIKPLPKYKPYAEPNLDWIGKEIITKDGSCCPTYKTLNITHVGEKNVIINSTMCLDFNQLLKRYVWKENNLPCGEIIK